MQGSRIDVDDRIDALHIGLGEIHQKKWEGDSIGTIVNCSLKGDRGDRAHHLDP